MTLHTTTLHQRRPFVIRPISRHGWSKMSGNRRTTLSTTKANHLYIKRRAGTDLLGSVDYTGRTDLFAEGIALPAGAPRWTGEPGRIWDELDLHMASRPADAIAAWHLVLSLPPALEPDQHLAMVERYARDVVASRGVIADWAIHARRDADGGWRIPPHVHVITTTRTFKHGSRHGEEVACWSGRAMRSRLSDGWMALLPADMRRAGTQPYRYGSQAPARLPLPPGLFGSRG